MAPLSLRLDEVALSVATGWRGSLGAAAVLTSALLTGALAGAAVALLRARRRCAALTGVTADLQALLDGVDAGVGLLGSSGAVEARNAALQDLLTAVPALAGALAAQEGELVVHDVQGAARHLFVQRLPRPGSSGGPHAVVVADRTALQRSEAARRSAEALVRASFEASPVGLVLVDVASGTVLAANAAFAALLDVPGPQLQGRALRTLLVAPQRTRTGLPVAGGPDEVEYRRTDGSACWAATTQTVVEQEGGADLLLLHVVDAEERRASRRALAHSQAHDALTGLADRRALVEHLSRSLGEGRRDSDAGSVGVLFVDLDGFKHVNDTYGHDAGDAVLTETARRLERVVRGDDHLARLGGDEFVVVTAPGSRRSRLVEMAERLLAALSAPVLHGGMRVAVTASIGVSVSRPGVSAADLLREADTAMYRAKALGRSRYEVFDGALREEVAERVRVERVLRDALSLGGLSVVYQPVVSQSGVVHAAEALVRLTTADGRALSPAAFIPVAERTGLVVPLGLHVLELALAQAAHWQGLGTPVRTAVNVSPEQLGRGDLAGTVLAAVDRHGVAPELLELEITETALIAAVPAVLRQLHLLRDKGVRIAIDDYGTGHASLAYLHRLPATTLKVDASFVAGIPQDRRATAIVRAVTQLAGDVGVECVAEGVETEEQRQWLAAQAPHALLQGYLLGRPVPAEDLSLFPVPRARGPQRTQTGLERSAG